MKKITIILLLTVLCFVSKAQNSKDTIIIDSHAIPIKSLDTSDFVIGDAKFFFDDTDNITHSIIIRDGNMWDEVKNEIYMERTGKQKYYDEIEASIGGKHYFIKIKGYVEYIIDEKGVKRYCN